MILPPVKDVRRWSLRSRMRCTLGSLARLSIFALLHVLTLVWLDVSLTAVRAVVIAGGRPFVGPLAMAGGTPIEVAKHWHGALHSMKRSDAHVRFDERTYLVE